MTRSGLVSAAGASVCNKRTDFYGNAYDQSLGHWGSYDDAAKEEQGILGRWLTKKRCEVKLSLFNSVSKSGSKYE